MSYVDEVHRAFAAGFHAMKAPDTNVYAGRDPYDTVAIDRWREAERLRQEWRVGPWWEKRPEDLPGGVKEQPAVPTKQEVLAEVKEEIVDWLSRMAAGRQALDRRQALK